MNRTDLGGGWQSPDPDRDPPNAVAVTPNGRYVWRQPDDMLIVQPHNDNYLIRVPDLATARLAFADPAKYR